MLKTVYADNILHGNSKMKAVNISMLVVGGFWAVILTRPAQARRWASVWPRSKHVVADEVCA